MALRSVKPPAWARWAGPFAGAICLLMYAMWLITEPALIINNGAVWLTSLRPFDPLISRQEIETIAGSADSERGRLIEPLIQNHAEWGDDFPLTLQSFRLVFLSGDVVVHRRSTFGRPLPWLACSDSVEVSTAVPAVLPPPPGFDFANASFAPDSSFESNGTNVFFGPLKVVLCTAVVAGWIVARGTRRWCLFKRPWITGIVAGFAVVGATVLWSFIAGVRTETNIAIGSSRLPPTDEPFVEVSQAELIDPRTTDAMIAQRMITTFKDASPVHVTAFWSVVPYMRIRSTLEFRENGSYHVDTASFASEDDVATTVSLPRAGGRIRAINDLISVRMPANGVRRTQHYITIHPDYFVSRLLIAVFVGLTTGFVARRIARSIARKRRADGRCVYCRYPIVPAG